MVGEADAVVALFHELHADLRKEVEGLDAAALNWRPAPDTNPIAVLVVHMLGSEMETVRMVRGLHAERDRLAEFRVEGLTSADLVQNIDAAEALLDELGPTISAENLAASVTHPRRGTQASGAYWLTSNFGHAREHLAHLQLTKQLYQARGA
jgi:hypothetical protein